MSKENFEGNKNGKKVFVDKEEERTYYNEAKKEIDRLKKELKKANEKEYEKLVNFIKERLERGEKPVGILEPMTEKFKEFFPDNEDDLIKLLFTFGIWDKKQSKAEKDFVTHKEENDNWETINKFREEYKSIIDVNGLCEELKKHHDNLEEIEKREGKEARKAKGEEFSQSILFKCLGLGNTGYRGTKAENDLEEFMRAVLSDPEKYSQRRDKKKEELRNNQ